MSFIELAILAVGLSMDAFAISVCKGLSLKKAGLRECCIAGAWFGGFQALMPLIGFFLGMTFEKYITAFDHWIAFVLLGIIGANMIKESLSKEEEEDECGCCENSMAAGKMFVMALATSIDALAVGITFAFLLKTTAALVFAIVMIGVTTFVLSGVGVRIGNIFGSRLKSKAELVGGIILVLLGIKILLEHLGVINF